MNFRSISAGFIFALAAFHSAAASDVLSAIQCAAATPQPAAQRPLSLRSAPSLACTIGPARFSPLVAEAEQNFSPVPGCTAMTPMPRLATVIE